jgi:thioredoxin reductase
LWPPNEHQVWVWVIASPLLLRGCGGGECAFVSATPLNGCALCVSQTSVDGVYAIGDVASFPLLCAGGASVRQEHVTHARSSAVQAAKSIMGEHLRGNC